MHQPSGGIGGTASDIKIQAELILHMKKVMAELTADQTGQTVDTSSRQRPRQVVHAKEALEYGFFDQIRRTRLGCRRRRNQKGARATEN